ncbi:MAG: hypothetical protein AB2L20_11040 [Mangrovibacterium sp.]
MTTPGRQASASELVITGLDPYMDVIHIGESTYGKYVGSYIPSGRSGRMGYAPDRDEICKCKRGIPILPTD